MTFTLLPAVDVAGGQAVRLVQGERSTETAYGTPRDAALAWQAGGAEWIHLVDLDAAFGRGSNAELLAAVVGELDVNVQLSGGIRDDAALKRALSTGCARVILGTAALEDPAWCARAIAAHGERIAVGLDVRVVEDPDGAVQHLLAARGWTRDGGDLWETLARLDRDGCARYVVTDVSKDGTLRGPNVELYRAVTRATTAPIIASGGVSAIGDLVVLAEVAATGANLEGAIVGKALYAGRFTLPEALETMRRAAVLDRPVSRAAMSSGPASRLTGMETERVSASTTIDAAPEAVFAVLADPSTHANIDGTGWVRESLNSDRITAAGQVFRMAMYHENHPDKDYKVANRVEVFDEPRVIAWQPGQESPETGELTFGGWIWRYDLEATGPAQTTVTLTYDWSAVPPQVREYLQFPPFAQDHLDNSLQHLSDLVA